MKSKLLFTVLIFVVFHPVFSEDWGWPEKTSYKKEADRPVYEKMISYYKTELSPQMGNRCPFHPSCSTFTYYSMKHFGFVTGFIMGMERIYLRENGGLFLESAHYEKISVKGAYKYYDHPQANHIFTQKNWHYYNAYFIAWPADSPVFDNR